MSASGKFVITVFLAIAFICGNVAITYDLLSAIDKCDPEVHTSNVDGGT